MRNKSAKRRGAFRTSRRSHTAPRGLKIETLENRRVLANIVINEFLASNDRELLDYHDDSSDWVEIQNNDTVAVDLLGWHLTDDITNLAKWSFPESLTLNPQDRAVIFASGLDFVAPNGEFHTNFKLSSQGEYLAIVEPDGTISSEVITYPEQFRDISYGVAELTDTTTFLGTGSTANYLVPTDDSLGTDWTATAFDDSSWTQDAASGLGYAVQGPISSISGLTAHMIDVDGGTDGLLNSATESLNVLNGNFAPGQYNIVTDVTGEITHADLGGGAGTFGGTLPYPNGVSDASLSDFAVRLTANLSIPEGQWSIGFGSDDGGNLQIGGLNFVNQYNTNGDQANGDDRITYEAPRGHGWTWGTITVPAGGGDYILDSHFYERGGGDSFEIAIRQGHTTSSPNGSWTILSDGALGWGVETIGIPPIPDFEPLVATDLSAQMYDQSPARTSAYMRFPFQVDNLADLDVLTLRMQYDDGFVAYLNGVEVARANATGDVSASSVADNDRDDELALSSVEYNVSSSLGLLVEGENVLAIHGLNAASDATGFFVAPQLIGTNVLRNDLSYLSNPTPGAPNGPGAASVASEPVFSVPTSTFTDQFLLELTAADPNAEIRYTLDGSVPGENSLVYTTPIDITTSTQIRAQTFVVNAVPSDVVSETFVQLSSDLDAFSSDLPVMILDTLTGGISASDFVNGSMLLMEPSAVDGRTVLTSAPTKDSRAGLKIRGSSSSSAQKKNYALEIREDRSDFDRNMSLLGMPSDSDWVLHAPDWFDRSLINNAYIYELSNQSGNYAVRSTPVEVFLNSNGGDVSNSDYVGVYILMEKIKRDNERVDVEKLSSNYSSEPDITGGYIVKFDRADPGDSGFSFSSDSGRGLTMRYVEPKEEEIEQNPAQQDYLTQYMTDLSNALDSANFVNPNTGLHYSEYIDVQSFIDHHILNELELNVDALRLSAYLHKPREGKLKAGPLWDFDRAVESNDSRDNNPTRWYMDIENVPWWWDRLFEDIDFRQGWIDRWQEWRQGIFSTDHMNGLIDQMTNDLLEASDRNLARWGGVYPARTSGGFASGELNGTFLGEMNHKKAWFETRVQHFDSQFVSQPTFSHNGGVISNPINLIITPSPGSTVYYTLDGTDPRLPGGSISSSAMEYTGPLAIDSNAVVTARAYDADWNAGITDFNPGNESWSGPVVRAFTTQSPPPFRITEFNYHPTDPTAEELSIDPSFVDDSFEFIEITNTGVTPLDIIGTTFTEGVDFTFPSYVVNPGEHVLVVANQAAYEARYGQAAPIVGEYSGGLSNNNEDIILVDAIGSVIHDFRYDDNNGWPERADGNGSTLEVIDTEGNYDDSDNWRASSEYLGSPSVAGTGYVGDIVINEVLSHTDLPQTDTIELHNTTDAPIEIGGWYLSDSNSNQLKFQIPSDIVIPAGDYITFDENDFNASLGVAPNDFALSSSRGEEVVLTAVESDGTITRYVDEVSFTAQANGESWGRVPNGTGIMYPQLTTTLGAANSGPRVGPVIISELMYFPTVSQDNEYVEIYNGSSQAVDLTEWRIRGGVDYEFDPGQSLAAHEVLLVISFNPENPANAQRLTDFRDHYGIGNEVRIVGGYSGSLDNDGETVRLQRPDNPSPLEPDFFPRLLEDETRFYDVAPWPVSAAGQGDSLTRNLPPDFGHDASSWIGDAPSPGTVPVTVSPPVVNAITLNAGEVDPPDLPDNGPQPTSWDLQRSSIYSIQIEFSQDVVFNAADFELINLGVDAPNEADVTVALEADNFVHQDNLVTLQFENDELTDGVYELRVLPTLQDTFGNPLDGNADGNGGDAFVYQGNGDNRFYRLEAEFNGDGGTTIFDFATFGYWFGANRPTAPRYADLNNDGGISIFDFGDFAANFGRSIAYPSSATRGVLAAPSVEDAQELARVLAEPLVVQAVERPQLPIELDPVRKSAATRDAETEESQDEQDWFDLLAWDVAQH